MENPIEWAWKYLEDHPVFSKAIKAALLVAGSLLVAEFSQSDLAGITFGAGVNGLWQWIKWQIGEEP